MSTIGNSQTYVPRLVVDVLPESRQAARRAAALKWSVRAGLACYALALAVGTHLPYSAIPARLRGPLPVSDKVIHFVGYAGLTALVILAVATTDKFQRIRDQRRGLLVLAALGAGIAIYGLCDEVTQPLVGRQFEWRDWIANAGGISLSLTLAAATLIVRRRPDR